MKCGYLAAKQMQIDLFWSSDVETIFRGGGYLTQLGWHDFSQPTCLLLPVSFAGVSVSTKAPFC